MYAGQHWIESEVSYEAICLTFKDKYWDSGVFKDDV